MTDLSDRMERFLELGSVCLTSVIAKALHICALLKYIGLGHVNPDYVTILFVKNRLQITCVPKQVMDPRNRCIVS